MEKEILNQGKNQKNEEIMKNCGLQFNPVVFKCALNINFVHYVKNNGSYHKF